jgi:protein gp37
MAETTGIQWTDSTFNPWIGCAKVSPGCDNCYAQVSTPSRALRVVWGAAQQRHRTASANWRMPLRWNAAHAEFQASTGRRRRVFCASLADVFDNQVDVTWRHDLWSLVRNTPHLDWLMLTKRIGNVAAMLPGDWGSGYPNVWLGISVVNQAEADRDISRLLNIQAAVRWLSMEPLLGPVSLGKAARRLDWVVVGGESGRQPRSMSPDWVRAIRDECESAGTAFFFKQWGGSDKDKGGCLLFGQAAKAWPIVT